MSVEVRTCPQCTATFTVVPKAAKKKYCTEQCRAKAYNTRQAIKAGRRPAVLPVHPRLAELLEAERTGRPAPRIHQPVAHPERTR